MLCGGIPCLRASSCSEACQKHRGGGQALAGQSGVSLWCWGLSVCMHGRVCGKALTCLCRGFIGAIGFTPMDFILPQFLWIAAYKPKGPK